MSSHARPPLDVLVIGAGPAGVVAAVRAARLGARTGLITRDALGGMAANDGPVPVRTLAQAARLIREARHLEAYGIAAEEPVVDYRALLARVAEVTRDVRTHSILRDDLERAGVSIHEYAGTARFVDPHTVESDAGPRLQARSMVICTGGIPRRIDVPGGDLTSTHSDAWTLTETPPSMLVVGAGATGVQVASIFNAFGSHVELFEAAPRILMTEDEDVAAAMREALRGLGVTVTEDGGRIDRFERCSDGVRLVASRDDGEWQTEAALAVAAIGWAAGADDLGLHAAGVETDPRGFVTVDGYLRTSAGNVYAAGDVTGTAMLVHEAVREGFTAATNAAGGDTIPLTAEASPVGSFTDPEYASVGLTEHAARESHEVIVSTIRFDALPRPIIDGRPTGFCKLIADRDDHSILGCHIVGERAVELAQVAAVAMTAGMRVEQLALVPFSFPTYANALGRAAVTASGELGALFPDADTEAAVS